MFGDWVFDKYHQANGKVTTTTRVLLWVALTDENHWQLKYDEVAPIPLTPEILEKNGFELKKDGWLWDFGNGYVFVGFCPIDGGVQHVEVCTYEQDTTDFRSIRYVHELQHALRLCKVEKDLLMEGGER